MSFIKNQIYKFFRAKGAKWGMEPAKVLEDEDLRVGEVKRLNIVDRDLSHDRRFNNITQVAAYLTDCPKSSINILDDQFQVTKSNYGFGLVQSTLFEQVPREITLCQYVLEKPHEQLIINDIDLDWRTKNIKRADLKFYAGSPLITSRGYTIGTLCVMNGQPGSLEHRQAEGLRLLADQVVTFLESDSGEFRVRSAEDVSSEKKLEAKFYSSATILFTDFVGFTKITESVEPGELLETIDEFFIGFDKICTNHKLKKVKTIGDSYMAVAGIPEGFPEHPKDACAAAIDMIAFVEGMNIQRKVLGREPWQIRVGIHTGPVIAGISDSGFDVWGDSVNIAARMEGSGEQGKVHISETTYQFLPNKKGAISRGKVELKNKGQMHTYFVDRL